MAHVEELEGRIKELTDEKAKLVDDIASNQLEYTTEIANLRAVRDWPGSGEGTPCQAPVSQLSSSSPHSWSSETGRA